MIVKVDGSNRLIWAEMCVLLWPRYTVSEILEELKDGRGGEGFLYYENKEPMGFINLSLRHDYVEGTSASPTAYIEGIFVKEEYRNQGIAQKLVDFGKAWGKEQGCKELASDCEIENENSRKFHNAIGFKEAGVIVCFTMDVD